MTKLAPATQLLNQNFPILLPISIVTLIVQFSYCRVMKSKCCGKSIRFGNLHESGYFYDEFEQGSLDLNRTSFCHECDQEETEDWDDVSDLDSEEAIGSSIWLMRQDLYFFSE